MTSDPLARLEKEGYEIEGIFSSSAGTARRNARSRRTPNPNQPFTGLPNYPIQKSVTSTVLPSSSTD